MSLSLEVSARSAVEDEYTKWPLWCPLGRRQKGQLKPNDKIIAVGQGESGEMVDVIGWRLDEVVQPN